MLAGFHSAFLNILVHECSEIDFVFVLHTVGGLALEPCEVEMIYLLLVEILMPRRLRSDSAAVCTQLKAHLPRSSRSNPPI
jgi:hypothetical protein